MIRALTRTCERCRWREEDKKLMSNEQSRSDRFPREVGISSFVESETVSSKVRMVAQLLVHGQIVFH